MIVETPVKLQPCPFCGGDVAFESFGRNFRGLYVTCKRCHVETGGMTVGKQIYCRNAGAILTESDVISRLSSVWNRMAQLK